MLLKKVTIHKYNNSRFVIMKSSRPTFDPEHEKCRQGWTETMENPPSERRQKAQIGAEMASICA